MSLSFGPGMQINRNYPVLDACPYCDATNIPRIVKNQKTCGKISCQAKHTKAWTEKRKDRAA